MLTSLLLFYMVRYKDEQALAIPFLYTARYIQSDWDCKKSYDLVGHLRFYGFNWWCSLKNYLSMYATQRLAGWIVSHGIVSICDVCWATRLRQTIHYKNIDSHMPHQTTSVWRVVYMCILYVETVNFMMHCSNQHYNTFRIQMLKLPQFLFYFILWGVITVGTLHSQTEAPSM